MQGPVSDFNYNALIGETQDTARDEMFVKTMEGTFSATITLVPFEATKDEEEEEKESAPVYRKFLYNEKGEVVKKLSFDENGNIEMKEETTYDDKGNILANKIITADNIVREYYEYNKGGSLVRYTFTDPKQPGIKYETNEIDENGRLTKTTSFGLLGTPVLISHFIYPEGKKTKYKFKHVTKPDGTLLITFYFTYDSLKIDSNLTGLYGFYLTPDEINNLLKESANTDEWEKESLFRSKWQYAEGKQTSFMRDEKIQPYHLDYGYISDDERILTDKTDFLYRVINGTKYPGLVTEWQPRFLEPNKVVGKYTYYDSKGKKIYSPKPKKANQR